MGPDDSWSILGVDHDADQRTIRKAYLKAIKRCRPETDPEGFAKIRSAYEALSGGDSTARAAPIEQPAAGPNSDSSKPKPDTPTADDCMELVDDAIESVEEGRLEEAQDKLRKMQSIAQRLGGWAVVCEHPVQAMIVARLEELPKVETHLTEEERIRLAQAFVHDDVPDVGSWWRYFQVQDPVRADRFYRAIRAGAPTIGNSFDWDAEDVQEAAERKVELFMLGLVGIVVFVVYIYKTLTS